MQNQPARRLLWSEEFADHQNSSLSPETWSYDIGDGSAVGLVGWGNNELEYYIYESISVSDNLKISAKKLLEPTELSCYYGPALWTSGKIHTAGKIGFKYGYLEIRAKISEGAGSWSALWLLGKNLLDGVTWPACGEIDIMEYVGKQPGEIHTTLHTPDSYGKSINTKVTSIESIEAGFHIYKTKWDANQIEFYIDDALVYTFSPEVKNDKTWPFDKPFYLILKN